MQVLRQRNSRRLGSAPRVSAPRSGELMTILAQLDEAAGDWDVFAHPFYQRWASGQLDRVQLAAYAAQYRFAVRALAIAAAAVRGADEPGERVRLWELFAQACRARISPPTYETVECAAAWRAGTCELDHLAVLYALGAAQPALARMKLAGLRRHYGFADEFATQYFRRQASHDPARACLAGLRIERLARLNDAARLVRRARAAARGYHRLLDGVERVAAEGRIYGSGAAVGH
jgi:pyrroloquinoline quinone (PQQ) biosynthesis protein C